MNGAQVLPEISVGNITPSNGIVLTGDFNGDGTSHILRRISNGDVAMWLVNNASVMQATDLGNVPLIWTVQNLNAE